MTKRRAGTSAHHLRRYHRWHQPAHGPVFARPLRALDYHPA
jgi:hypothetical protein